MNPPNLLDEALGFGTSPKFSTAGRVILVEDCVETSGAFVLHHLMKRSLSSDANGVLIFVAFAQPFSHYDRILKKLGYNLSIQRENNRLHYLDMLKEFPGERGSNAIESGLYELYAKIQRAVDVGSSKDYSRGCITIMIDDLSLLEIAAHGCVDHVLDFLHYCVTLTSELDCSLVILNHKDIFSSIEAPKLLPTLEYIADIVIMTEPLATGLAADVHGQMTIRRKGSFNGHGSHAGKISSFHFRVKENGVEYFYPGSHHLG